MWRCILLLSLAVGGCRFTVGGTFGNGGGVGSGGDEEMDGGEVAAPDLAAAPDLTTVDPCAGDVDDVDGGAGAECAAGMVIELDGDLSEWANVPFVALTKSNAAFSKGTWSGTPAADDANSAVSFATRWDPNFLYVAARINDDVRGVFPASPNYSQDDSLQLFLDGDHSRSDGAFNVDDHEIVITADGRSQDAQYGQQPHAIPAGVLFAVGKGPAQGWTAEVAIPWSVLGNGPAKPGRTLGLDVAVSDDDSATFQTQNRLLVWKFVMPASGCKTSPACNTQIFGDLQLMGR